MANIPWNALDMFASFPSGVDVEGALSMGPQDFGTLPFVRVVIPKAGTLHELAGKITANTFAVTLTIGLSINGGPPVLPVTIAPIVSGPVANGGSVPVAAGDVVSYRIVGPAVGSPAGIEGGLNVLYTPNP